MQHYFLYKFDSFLCILQFILYTKNEEKHLNWG